MTDQNSDVRKAHLDEARRFVPTTEQVRAEYVTNRALRVPTTVSPAAEFDRWLAEHDAQVAAQALRDTADAVEVIDPAWDSALCIDRMYHPVPEWLRARADRIAAGGES